MFRRFADRLHARAHFSGLHGRGQINRQRLIALVMIITGLVRVTCWLTLITLYLLGVPFTKALFTSVAFVAVISLYANAATDWGQVAASLAMLTAGDAHQDVEHTRQLMTADFAQLEDDISRLADMQPGQECHELADSIKARLPR